MLDQHTRVVMRSVSVSIMVRVLRTDILELVDASALRAALDRSVARAGQPDNDVGVDGAAGAAEVLLVTEGLDYDGVVEGACPQEYRSACVSSNDPARCLYLACLNLEASCQRCRRPASFRGFQVVQDRSLARDR